LKRPVQETPRELDAIRAALRLADNQGLVVFVGRDAELDGGPDSCWVEALACRIPEDEPSMFAVPAWFLQFFEGGPRYAVLRWRLWLPKKTGVARRRLRKRGTAFLQVERPLTLYSHPAISYSYHECETEEDWRALRRLEKRMQNLPLSGRTPGSGHPVTVEAVTRAYWEWVENHGKPPTQDDLAELFYLKPRRFKERLSELYELEGFEWPPTQPELLGN
jgi:hypothetical protein